MERTGRVLVLLALLIGVSSGSGAVAHKTKVVYAPWTNVPAIFAFGDSLIDAGTNNFIEGSTTLANFLPYGETFFHKPTGRFSNGRLTFDFIANALGIPFMPPFLKNTSAAFCQGVNFGSAGSGILSTTGVDGGVIPLRTQVSQFQQVATKLTTELGDVAASNLISKSLFFFVTGGNDMSAYLRNATIQNTTSPTQFVTSLLSELQADIQAVYSLGARKVVLFGIGPLGCAPQTMAAANGTNGQCVAAPNQLAQAYNAALVQLMEGLNSKLPNLYAVVANPFDTIERFVVDGTAHGFTGGSNACCGAGPFNAAVRCGTTNTTTVCENVGNFVFWDALHPTQRVYRIIARLLWGGDSSFVQPMNLEALSQL